MNELKSQFAAGTAAIQAQLGALAGEFANSRRANWGEYRGWALAGMGAMTLIGSVLVMFVQTQIAPLVTMAEVSNRDRQELYDQLRSVASTQQQRSGILSNLEQNAARLSADLGSTSTRLERMSAVASTNSERVTKIETALTEVEAQFCWLSDQVNLRFANRGQFITMLWAKVMGMTIPPEPTVPRVGRCN
jgi:hypothetical protein